MANSSIDFFFFNKRTYVRYIKKSRVQLDYSCDGKIVVNLRGEAVYCIQWLNYV